MADAKKIVYQKADTDLVSTTPETFHGGTNVPNEDISTPPANLAISDDIRIPSQAIRNFTTRMTGIIHTVKLYGGHLFESKTIADIAKNIEDFRRITICEIKVYITILYKQGHSDRASFKSLYEIAKLSRMGRNTKPIKDAIETLKTNKIYTADTRKKHNKTHWTKTQFVESVESEAHTYKNVYLPTDKSKAKFNFNSFFDYLESFSTKSQEVAFYVFALVMQRVSEKSNHQYRWITITELEEKIFYISVVHRNDYKPLLFKCLDKLKEISIIEGYTPTDTKILLHKKLSSNKRKSSYNKRKSSYNKRKSSYNKRNPPDGNIDFID